MTQFSKKTQIQKMQSNFIVRNFRIFFAMIKDPEFFVDRESHSLFRFYQHFRFCEFENHIKYFPNFQQKIN